MIHRVIVMQRYVIERRTILADRTDVMWFAGVNAGFGSYRWDDERRNAHELTYAAACSFVRHFRAEARRLGQYHVVIRRHAMPVSA